VMVRLTNGTGEAAVLRSGEENRHQDKTTAITARNHFVNVTNV
jgi:hypothetical protein